MGTTLNSSAEMLLKSLNFLNTPAMVLDSHGLVLSANQAACGLLRYRQEELVGRDLPGLMPDGSGKWEDGEKPGDRFESSFTRRDGSVFMAEVSVVPIGSGEGKLVVVKDLSDHKRLEQRASQRRKELSIFSTFARILTRHTEIERILQDSIEMLPSIMGAQASWIHVYDAHDGELVLRASAGLDAQSVERIKTLRPGECLSGKVFEAGRPLMVKRADEDPRISRAKGLTPSIQSIASVPVFSRGSVWGVLSIAGGEPSAFSAMDMQILSIMGSQIGAAAENARLIGELNSKMQQIELINELSGTINSSLSIGTVFRIMAAEIGKLVGYDRASLLLYNEKDDNMVIFALSTEIKTVLPRGVKAPIEGTSAGWALKNNRPWINYDLKTNTRFPLDQKLMAEGIRSTVSIPLYQDKMLGVFNLDSTEPSKYSERDLDILMPVSRHISIALENALLFEEISKEKKEWEMTFDAITDMVWVEDASQRVIRANHALLKKVGLPVVDIVGRHCDEVLEMVGAQVGECPCCETLRSGAPAFAELTGDGGGIFHLWAYPLSDDQGGLYAIVHYLKDVTVQKKLEQRLIRADKLASLGTLVAGIAHEINNPLGIIAGYSEALKERAGDVKLLGMREFEDFPEYLQTINDEIFRCKEILGGLLEFARPHVGITRKLDINEIIKEVILLVDHKAKRHGHNVELKLSNDLPKITAEPGSLRQIFMNIIINSMYFTPEGGSIVVETALEEPGEGGGMIRVIISDTGTGISQDILEKVFDPFFTTKPVGEGSGLGLSICHRLVRELGGTIDVGASGSGGAAFVIKLPPGAER